MILFRNKNSDITVYAVLRGLDVMHVSPVQINGWFRQAFYTGGGQIDGRPTISIGET